MSESDLFKEIDADLRAEKMHQMMRRYAIFVGGVVVIALLALGGWQFWRWQHEKTIERASLSYLTLMQEASPSVGGELPEATRQRVMQEFKDLANKSPQSIRTLAALQEAGLAVKRGDTKKALQIWDAIQNDQSGNPTFQALASLLWIQNNIDHGDPVVLRSRLNMIIAEKNPWHALAKESEALLDIRIGKMVEARQIFAQLVQDVNAPIGVRKRASNMLQIIAEDKETK